MRYWTWGEIREKIEDEFDLQEEPDMLSEGELCGYLNDAIDSIEQFFVARKYFLSATTIAMVAGQRDYDLPTDIYANKIKKLIYDYNEIKPIKDLSKITIVESLSGVGDFCYILINSGSRPKIRILPTPQESGTMDLYYVRNAARIEEDGDDDQEIDIPEANLYIIEHLRREIYRKEKNWMMVEKCDQRLKELKISFEDALDAQTDDDNNFIEPDTSFLEDHV